MTDTTVNTEVLNATVGIVTAALANGTFDADGIQTLINSTFATVSALGTVTETPEVRPEPAVAIRNSVKNDYIVCLEDGKKLKMLKRHLMTSYNLTPDQYRARWELPSDYPMVAPAYAEKRRELAKSIGLGRKPKTKASTRSRSTAVEATSEATVEA